MNNFYYLRERMSISWQEMLVSGGAARPFERDAARHVSTLDLLDLFEALFTILLYVNSVKTCRDAFLRLSKQDCRINRLSRRLGSWLRRKNASLQFGNNRAAHIKWNSSHKVEFVELRLLYVNSRKSCRDARMRLHALAMIVLRKSSLVDDPMFVGQGRYEINSGLIGKVSL